MVQGIWRRHKTSHYRAAFSVFERQVVLTLVDSRGAVVVNDSMEVTSAAHNPEQVVSVITQLQQRYQRFLPQGTPVTLVLSVNLYQSFNLEKPNLPSAEIASALTYSLTELVDAPPEDLLVDYHDFPIQLGQQAKINVMVARKSIVKAWLQPLHKAKFAIQGVVPEEQMLARLLAAQTLPTLTLFQAEADALLMLVTRNGQLVMTRRVQHLTALHEAHRRGVDADTLDTLLVEIQRSADYYSSQLRQGPIQAVVLALQLRENDRVAEAIQQQLSLQIAELELPEDFRQLSDGDGSDLANLGALQSSIEGLERK